MWRSAVTAREPRALCAGTLPATAAVALLAVAGSACGQDDYLRALEAEAGKVTAASPAAEHDSEQDSDTAAAGNAVPAVRAQASFEALLESQYRGTFVFYKQLPVNVQEEFAAEFARGAPVAELRGKVVDRYLQK